MSLRLPSISLPRVSLPKVSLPDIDLPDVSLPKLPRLPKLPKLPKLVPNGEYVAARAPSAAETARAKAALEAKYAGTRFEGELPLRVITFNTAVGNDEIKTNQADFPKLPFYRDVVAGKPDAPILALQEVGPAQVAELKRLAKNGNFSLLLANAKPGQSNALLIPKRYEVVSQRSKALLEGQVKGVADTLWSKLKGDERKIDAGQLVEARMFSEAQLVDRFTGKRFTMFNTHISAFGPLRSEHAKQLFAEVRRAEARGPVVVAGDLNVRTAATTKSADDARIRELFGPLKDMGAANSHAPGKRSNIDWVLADGFDAGTTRWYLGDSLQLSGSPDADLVSDHYAEEDVFTFR